MVRRRLSPGKSVSAWTGKTTGRRLRSTDNASNNTSKALVPTKQQPSSPNLQSQPQSQSQTSKPQTENKGFQFSKRTKTYATMGVAAGATGAAVGHMVGGKSEKTGG